MPYNTGNPVPSSDFRDLSDNAANLDTAVNDQEAETWIDRLGQVRRTFHGMETEFVESQADREARYQQFLDNAGYEPLGDYAADIEITGRNQVVRQDGELWRISASVELPYTTTGDWGVDSADFVAVGDGALRQELADPAQGGELVQVSTSSGTQTLAAALNARLKADDLGDADVTATGGTSGRGLSDRFADVVSPLDFGGVGDGDGLGGGTDDSAAVQAVLDHANAVGGAVIDLLGRTYRVDGELTIYSNTHLRNGGLDCTSSSNATGVRHNMLSGTGALTDETLLTADAPVGRISVDVADASAYSEGDIVWISSDDIFDTNINTTEGEFTRVLSVTGNTIRFQNRTLGNYTTANNAKLRKFDPVENLVFENLKCYGRPHGDVAPSEERQYALVITHGYKIKLDNVTIHNFEEVGAYFDNSHTVTVSRLFTYRNSRRQLGYGISIARGCCYVSVQSSSFEYGRHGVQIGGILGVNRWIIVQNSFFRGQSAHGIDSHSSSQFVDFSHNMVEADEERDTLATDGIVCEGLSFVAIGNTVQGAHRNGIEWRPAGFNNLPANRTTSCDISGNNILGGGAGGGVVKSGIKVHMHTAGPASEGQVTITGNVICGRAGQNFTYGIYVEAEVANIGNLSITGNAIRQYNTGGVFLQAKGTNSVWKGVVSTNTLEGISAATSGVLLEAVDAGSQIREISITGNFIRNGDYGIRGLVSGSAPDLLSVRSNFGSNLNIAMTANLGAGSTIAGNDQV